MEMGYLTMSEEDYEECKNNISELREWVYTHAPDSWIYGYGIYDYSLCERDGKKMVEVSIGFGCD